MDKLLTERDGQVNTPEECAIFGNMAVIELDHGILFWNLMSNCYWVVHAVIDGERVDLDGLPDLGFCAVPARGEGCHRIAPQIHRSPSSSFLLEQASPVLPS